MVEVSTIGLDLAKNVFQVHGVDAKGQVVIRRQVRRSQLLRYFAKLPSCLIGMEACAGAHYWARELIALGHQVKLMPPTRVKPHVKWGSKNDAADAKACCDAVTRTDMRFVPVKTPEQQSALALHRARDLLVRQQTRLCNAIRGHLAEFGIVRPKGERGMTELVRILRDHQDTQVPTVLRRALLTLVAQLDTADQEIGALDRQIVAWHKTNDDSRRLATIPQLGPLISSAIVVTVGDAGRFQNARQFAAWLGLVPSQNSTGGKQRLGGITKTGDRYLRRLLVLGATGMIRRVRTKPDLAPWFTKLLGRKPAKQAAVALANKMARIVWAILVKGGTYRAPAPAIAPTAA